MAALAAALFVGCQKAPVAKTDTTPAPPLADPSDANAPGTAEGSGGTEGSGSAGASASELPPTPTPDQDIDSKDILARPVGPDSEVDVKHILLAWKDLAPVYGDQLDARAKQRTNAEAAKLATELADQLRAKPDDIDALIKAHSEDPGSLEGRPYTVEAGSPFVPEFKNLSLRLKEQEVGIVRTEFGYHVIERIPPPPLDPLESAAILQRPANSGDVLVRHILLGWKDVPMAKRRLDPRAEKRTKQDADKLAADLLARVKKGRDITKLMKELSEDPGSATSGKIYTVNQDTPFVAPFKKLALRLKLGEAGLVKTDFGWHVIKRVPPPPPDKLESAKILKRTETVAQAKVKHILLGWTEVHASDPRGEKRTRAALEKLVARTVASLKKGAKIEPLMKELSEDPGSAASGVGYDVTPDAALVQPFKDLALRLKLNEVGVVKTDFGIHILQRVE